MTLSNILFNVDTWLECSGQLRIKISMLAGV